MGNLTLAIDGMTCNSCAARVERALHGVAGVRKAEVPGWRSGKAVVTLDGKASSEALVKAVEAVGYRASLNSYADEEHEEETHLGRYNGDRNFDLLVIGGGSAGFAAAIKGAELGHRVALVETGTIGGTCVNVGCIPSKTFIRALEQAHLAGQSRFRGVHTMAGHLDWPQVVAHKDELVAEMRRSKYEDVLAAYSEITYLQGHARMTGGMTVDIDGSLYTASKIIIATGAQPWSPPIPGLERTDYLTSTTVMDLRELPKSMLVLGANAVGLELAQVFSRAGVFVTVLELLPRILPFEDAEIGVALQGYLVSEGLPVVTGYKTTRVAQQGGRFYLYGERADRELAFDAEQLLVATGRRPNTAGLGLEAVGVELGQHGEVPVDNTLQTAVPDIYAIGDVIGQEMFVYVAAYHGGLAAENALTGASRTAETAYIPRVTFTDPQVASAGLTENQAIELGHPVRSTTLEMKHVPRALASRDTRGLIKLIAEEGSDRLLGAHILAPEAGEMIQIASLALRFGLTVRDLRETIFPYLTHVEGIRLAALSFEKEVTLLSCCAA